MKIFCEILVLTNARSLFGTVNRLMTHCVEENRAKNYIRQQLCTDDL